MRPIMTALFLLLLAAPARANECDITNDQSTMNECAAMDFKAADSELNSAYGELKAGYAQYPDVRTLLTKAQRAWLAFRDAECELTAAPNEGGSVEPMIRSQCLAELTRARVADIRTRLACQAGDLTCVSITDDAD